LHGEADPWREAEMAEAPTATRSDNGTPALTSASPNALRSDALARTLDRKLEQGFTIESQSDRQAVVVMKGRSRWFGLANAASVRYEISVDEDGHASSRRV
jgi:hypothetical protein